MGDRPEHIDMRSYERQGITDLQPQVHLGPAIAALENQGIHTARCDRNRKIIHVNSIISALQRAVAALSEWLHSISETIRQHEVIADPGDYHLADVMMSCLELRKADRETWSHRAQSKGALNDLQAISKAVTFLRDRDLDTVHSLATYLKKTGARLSNLRNTVRQKEQRIRDIDALLTAEETVKRISVCTGRAERHSLERPQREICH